MTEQKQLPHNFRKLSLSDRKKYLHLNENEEQLLCGKLDLSDLSDVLIEGCVGTLPFPFGIATGFYINGKEFAIPMVTEEPSVIAAATQGALFAKCGGGFTAHASDSIVTAQIFLKQTKEGAADKIMQSEELIRLTVNTFIPGMINRGGGYRGLDVEMIYPSATLCVSIHLDVQDAMGANLANTVAEGLKELLCALSQGHVLMAILTNASENRTAKATFCIPEKYFRKGKLSGASICQKIVEANNLACDYPKRAVTHNKGIMNGVIALVLATGNDTRAVEAAAHFYAQKEGKYHPLTHYHFENGHLNGLIELPLPIGTIGGSISVWPPAELALKLLGKPRARELCQIAATLGLAQNLAALFALVTEGIQAGHMTLHAARIAYAAGARGEDVRRVGAELWSRGTLNNDAAKKILDERR